VKDQNYWLFVVVDPNTSRLLYVRLLPTRTSPITEMSLTKLREKHFVDDAIFLVDGSS
jgi:hypothetical protein